MEEEKEARGKTSFVNDSFDDTDLFGAPEASGGGGKGRGERQSDLFSGVEEDGELNGYPFGGGANGVRERWLPSRGETSETPKLEFFEHQSSSEDEGEGGETMDGQSRCTRARFAPTCQRVASLVQVSVFSCSTVWYHRPRYYRHVTVSMVIPSKPMCTRTHLCTCITSRVYALPISLMNIVISFRAGTCYPNE